MGNDDAVNQVEDGVAYHVFCMKDPDYLMKLMTTYGTLDPTDKRARRKFKRGGVMETKEFMYMEVVANHFLYRHQVDDNNNRRYAPMSIDRTWATKYWPDRCFAWYLAVPEVNGNYARAYFQDISNSPPRSCIYKMVFFRSSFANMIFNSSWGEGIATILKVCSSVVPIHFWGGKVPSKATIRKISGSRSYINVSV